MFVMIPVHFFVSCPVSEVTAEFALGLLLVTGVLSIIARRFAPFGWALMAMVLHSMSVH